ncbi:MAG TPA: nucleotidyltransferase domain-containing protein [Candidatus Paceibacterota bacterium]|nr:nucleotidyltransferase domain-containing protein [Candidatus Paceibacterota bacterium]
MPEILTDPTARCKHGHRGLCFVCRTENLPRCAHGKTMYCGFCGGTVVRQGQTKAVHADRARAHRVATAFLRHPRIAEVLLFGSVARDGEGRDLDLILVTEESLAYEFMLLLDTAVLHHIPHGPDGYRRTSLREDIAEEVLSANFYDVLREAKSAAGAAKLDLFLFPPDWRNQLKALQDAIPHKDPDFMANVARDAVSLVRRPEYPGGA